jgi:hypothetical protein
VKSQVAARIVRVAAEAVARVAPAVPVAAAPVPPVPVPSAPMKVRRLPRLKIAAAPQDTSPQEQRLAEAGALPQPPADTPAALAAPPAPVPQPMPMVAASMPVPQSTAVKEVLVALYPQGNGDPDIVTCRSPEPLPGSRLPGPKVCQTNRQWASLRARHEDITPDGAGIILPNGSELQAGFAALNCARERITGTGPAISTAVFGVQANVCF